MDTTDRGSAAPPEGEAGTRGAADQQAALAGGPEAPVTPPRRGRGSPAADDTDAALAAADKAIDQLLASAGSGRKLGWLRPVEEDETSDGGAESPDREQEGPADAAGVKTALFFELTENLDGAGADNAESDYGLSLSALRRAADNVLPRVEEPPGARDLRPLVLRYELTEDMGALDQDWQDADFGLADWQLEELWRRFGSRVVGGEPVTARPRGWPAAAQGRGGAPAGRQAAALAGEPPAARPPALDASCPDALHSAGGAAEDAGLARLQDFIGDHTLEQFLGQGVPPPPPGGMRVWMLSTRKLDGEDWYLFKVTDRGVNRFYMKTFADFEELHAALQEATPRGRTLPALPQKDFLGLRQWIHGADFSSSRAAQLRAYVDGLMFQFLTPLQERVLRAFFGPAARGQIAPPSAGPRPLPPGPAPGGARLAGL